MSRFGLVLVAAGLFLAGGGVHAEGLVGPHAAQARQACAAMGLNTSEAPFVYCVMSLNQSAAAADEATLVRQGRRECLAKGLQSGTPAFANCVLDREQGIHSVAEAH